LTTNQYYDAWRYERLLMETLLNLAAQLMEIHGKPIEDRARELTALRNALELMK
jgi:hypothetical protein